MADGCYKFAGGNQSEVIMATSVRLLRRYVWLIDTLRRAGQLTLEEISCRWADNDSLNSEREKSIPERTFHRHREAILDMFGVEIVCNRATNKYYIKDIAALEKPSFTSWVFNGLALDNQLLSSQSVRDRIVFERSPAGAEFMAIIIEALSDSRVLDMCYRGYHSAANRYWKIEPCGLKQHRRRWYLIARKSAEDCLLTFALDRIISLEITDQSFEPRDGEAIDDAFADVIGTFVDPDLDVEDVKVRVYGHQRHYFEGTPLHRSQVILRRTSEYTDYEFRLRPEYEFQHEILRLGPDAEVLSPQWLRDEMKWYAEESLQRYSSDKE